ncbi:hypothetical protein HA402_011215 [Bradysia odoriphaga]|nr:hypothetical protein HA402_011215 [Bradysia odoriphaga]
MMVEPQILIDEFVESTDPRSVLYNKIAKLRLSDPQLREYNFPRKSTTPGLAYLPTAHVANDEKLRKCDQCGNEFNLAEYDQESVNQCRYHPNRKTDQNNAYLCCKKLYGSFGCTFNYHVTAQIAYNDLAAFISVPTCDINYVPTQADIFALDCEMCYTVAGSEIIRITVVDIDGKVVYDTYVKPTHRVINYNTAYSGMDAKSLENVTCTLSDVQAKLCSMFHSKTILIGHSLESDLKALKLVHSMVVDTSVLFIQHRGRRSPVKRRLKTVVLDFLHRHIQIDGSGHSSLEDAKACIDLVLFKVQQKTR